MSRLITALGLVFVLALARPAAGQGRIEFDFGVRAGLPFTVPLESRLTGPAGTFTSQAFSTPRISGGPAFAVVFGDRLNVQFDVIYKTVRFDESFFDGTTYHSTSSKVSSWEFPLIADYAIFNHPIRPFGGGGVLLGQRLSGAFMTQLPAYVINGGLEWRSARFNIRPELRYTRWSPVSQTTHEARRNNQFEYMVGFSFRGFRR